MARSDARGTILAGGIALAVGTLAAFAMLMACGPSGPTGPAAGHTAVSQDLSELRAQFNADAGRVRAIFLAAPT